MKLQFLTSSQFLNYALGLTLYSGAVIPLGLALWVARTSPVRHQKLWRLQKHLFFVQVACFLPFAIEVLIDHPDFIHALLLPAIVGLVLFFVGIFHLGR